MSLPMPLDEFLTTVPLLELRTVVIEVERGHAYELVVPPVQLHCRSENCGGIRYFDPTKRDAWLAAVSQSKGVNLLFFSYRCRNCQTLGKVYALKLGWNVGEAGYTGQAIKIGEEPRFGEPRPNIVKEVLDDEIEFFERGYRAETDGLGIGAFAYYRRFVESHKNKIIDEIRKVAVAQGAKPEVMEAIDRARKSISFEKAVDAVKQAIPDSLRYAGGHNPLTLLHTALSQGLHSDDDVECLELAKDIRLVLTDLAERTTAALKATQELDGAVKRLLEKGARGKQ